MSASFKRSVGALALVFAVGSTTGCATVTRGVHQDWNVQTTPSGAQVTTSNGYACDRTPCSFRMERRAEFNVTIRKDGYRTWTGHVSHRVSAMGGVGVAGSLILNAGAAGLDVASGAMLDLKPNPLKVTLEKLDATAADARPAAAGNH